MFYPCHQKGHDAIKRHHFYNLNLLARINALFHISFILDKGKDSISLHSISLIMETLHSLKSFKLTCL